MTTLTDTQVVTASGGLVELGFQSTDRTNLAVSGTSTSNAVELVATTVVCDGSPVLVEFQCGMAITNGEYLSFGVWVDGTYTATFEGSMAVAGRSPISAWARLTPSAGSRVISIRWWKWSGGTSTSYIEGNCRLRVSKIVQATQWPAVTTGTIICTSTTRPASPFQGQEIYETDTSTKYQWTGSVWLPLSPAPYVRIKAGAAQTGIVSATWTKMTFPTATVVNPYGFTVSSGTVTIPSGYGGLYAVQAQVQWDANTTADRLLAFGLAGASYASDGISGQSSPPTVQAYYRSSLSGLMQLASGSSYTLWGLQGSGSNRSTEISFSENWLHLVRVA